MSSNGLGRGNQQLLSNIARSSTAVRLETVGGRRDVLTILYHSFLASRDNTQKCCTYAHRYMS